MRIIKNRTASLNIRTKPEIKEGLDEICIDRNVSITDFLEEVIENEITQHRESKESEQKERSLPSATSAPDKKR
ncbi:hypothetical protein ALO82_200185 [Pseudomonas syringae pv. broussonetiae]|uniref:ribbon-helix-helix protein, CopG family n=1 Tax=Pseudomonas savastanoi TaxID=29438 RepID=UPI0006E580FE|nr:ribbon-helix-helix protein, CopG family [Pseudomonas savastanoi]KPW62902.1 hypothetical protein ALO82_200185 [Pseudomonas syringae pv. broussonetiae]